MDVIGNWYFLIKICKSLSAENILNLSKSCKEIYELFKNNNSLINYYYSASLLSYYQIHYFSQYDCLLDWGLGNVSFKDFFLKGHFNENHSIKFIKNDFNIIKFKGTLKDNFGIPLIFYAILFYIEGKDFTDWEDDPAYLEELEQAFNNNNKNSIVKGVNYLNDYFYAINSTEEGILSQLLNDFAIKRNENSYKQKILNFLLEFEKTYRGYQKYSLYAELVLSLL